MKTVIFHCDRCGKEVKALYAPKVVVELDCLETAGGSVSGKQYLLHNKAICMDCQRELDDAVWNSIEKFMGVKQEKSESNDAYQNGREWLENHGFKATEYGMSGGEKLVPEKMVVQTPVEWTDDFGVKVKVRWDGEETRWEADWYYAQDFEGYGETPGQALSELSADIKRQYEDTSDTLKQWLALENHLSFVANLNQD